LQAVSHQPTSVFIDANVTAFQLYAGGIFDAPCGTKLDHLVLVSFRNGAAVLWLIRGIMHSPHIATMQQQQAAAKAMLILLSGVVLVGCITCHFAH
jgi:Papain family cysteine protease